MTKFILGILALFFVLNGCVSCQEGEGNEKPNILFLFTDDQRYGTIGELNQDEVETPNLDRLVNTGISFSNAYILGAPHGAVCSPSRAMLMTGRHYFHISPNVYAQFSVPQSERGKCDLLTFPEHFKRNGYVTFATGKQHNGRDWVERGFDHGKAIYLGGMTKHFGTKVKDFEPESGWTEVYSEKEKFSSELFADSAIGFLKDYKGEKPFLMYVSFTAPHDPRTPPVEDQKRYPPEGIKLPPNFQKEHPFKIADMKIRDEKLAGFPRQEDEIKKHMADYYAMITATDSQIGRIIDALEQTGKRQNTIIVFSGDNGLAVGQHGLMGKQNVYEHSIKVPLIFCGPGISKNIRKKALVYLHDLFPTFCGLTGLEIPASVQTENIAPILKGEKEKVRDAMHFCYNGWPGDILREKPGEASDRGAHRAIRRGDWKLILSSKEGVLTTQLFNLKEDPWEINNMANNPAYSTIKEELISELKTLISETGDPARLDQNEFGLYDEANERK